MHKRLLMVLKILIVVTIFLLLFMSRYQKMDEQNSLFGYRVFVIVSESMKPKLNIGDMILVRERHPKNIEIGDIVSYQGLEGDLDGKIITHQVEEVITEEGRQIFYTKGVNNILIDPAVYEEQIYGVVEYRFIILSVISKIVRSTAGFLLVVFIPSVLVIFFEVKSIRKQLKEARSSE